METSKDLWQQVYHLAREERIYRYQENRPYQWFRYARENQKLPLGLWKTWLILAGRGFGKTRTGAETIRRWIERGKCRRLALIAETEDQARSVMIEGQSGLLNVFPPHQRPIFEPSLKRLRWENGAVAYIFSGDNYNALRGPQFDGAWVDELAKFAYAQETWDQLMMGLRLGENPQVVVTTTPRPIPLIKRLMANSSTYITRGSTFDNKDNLSADFIDYIKENYRDTSLGRQELYGEIVEDSQGALWTKDLFSYWEGDLPKFNKIVIGVDPAVTFSDTSDSTGIIVVGYVNQNLFIVLEDATLKASPQMWVQKVIHLYKIYEADTVVVEVNNGGDVIEQLFRTYDSSIPLKKVRATRDKMTRAEPVAALYRQEKVKHVKRFYELEEEMLSYHGSSSSSPDRLDALVWALSLTSFTPPPKVWSF